MIDNDTIKALESCTKTLTAVDCEQIGCPAFTPQGCTYYLRTDIDEDWASYVEIIKDALALINRQNAEIERLQTENLILSQKRINLFERLDFIERARIKAFKELAEELKQTKFKLGNEWVIYVENIDTVANNLIGETK